MDSYCFLRAGIKGLFVLMPLLGVGWILGLFALNDGTKVFIYAFSIVNGFQVSVLNMSSCEGVLLHLNLKHMEKNT